MSYGLKYLCPIFEYNQLFCLTQELFNRLPPHCIQTMAILSVITFGQL